MPLNMALLGNWQNWARVLLMVIVGCILFDILASNLTLRKDER